MSGLYLHIPFCKQHCHYCNFHFATSMRDKEAMLSALCQELGHECHRWPHTVQTIYFGGGTPSLLSIDDIGRLLACIDQHFIVAHDVEITLEANPDDLTEEYILGLRGHGIHRLSLGTQSLHEADLTYMHRAHTVTEAVVALEGVMAAGFDSVSIDLIYGLPTLSDEAWLANLDQVIDMGVPHLSCYQLTVEPGTPLQAFIDRGSRQRTDDEQMVRQFDLLLDRMETAGYEAYEISNYALPGHRSKHNSSYWQGVPYLGIGPSAHSFDGIHRWSNTVVNKRYVEEAPHGRFSRSVERLDEPTRYNEYVLTQLRRIEGLDLEVMSVRWPEQLKAVRHLLADHTERGLLMPTTSGYTLTRTGKHWADRISMELMVV